MSTQRTSDRAFGFAFAAVFGVIAGVGWLAFGRIFAWAGYVSGLLFAFALVAPSLLMPLNRLWTRLAARIAIVSNTLLLGAFFFLVVWPFGLVGRHLRAGFLRKRPDTDAQSYWTPVGRQASVESYPDPF